MERANSMERGDNCSSARDLRASFAARVATTLPKYAKKLYKGPGRLLKGKRIKL